MKYIGGIALLAVIIALVLMNPSMKISREKSGVKISGTITDVYLGCLVDANCQITLGGKTTIIFASGRRVKNVEDASGTEIGAMIGFGDGLYKDGDRFIGKRVEAFVAEAGENLYTLEGSGDYYIKLLD